jgi:hypothetical protein
VQNQREAAEVLFDRQRDALDAKEARNLLKHSKLRETPFWKNQAIAAHVEENMTLMTRKPGIVLRTNNRPRA